MPSAPRPYDSSRGSEYVCDIRLIDLALQSPLSEYVCYLLMQAQVLTWIHRAHIMDLSDRDTLTKLRRGLQSGRLGLILVRCLRCGQQAWMQHWIKAALPEGFPFLGDMGAWEDVPAVEDLRFLSMCRGTAIVAEGLDMLK